MDDIYARHLGAAYRARSVYLPHFFAASTFLCVAQTVYAVYIGTFDEVIRPKYVRFCVSTAGSSTQVAEVAIASTPLPAYGTNQTLTITEANATLTDLTGTGNHANTVAFALAGIAPGRPTWALLRTEMAGTEPTVLGGFQGGVQRHHLLTVAGASAMTTGATLSGVVPSFSTSIVAPYLFLSDT